MLGLPLDFWRHLRTVLPPDAWREFLETVRATDTDYRYDKDCARFSIAQAVCWLAHDFGGSEFCVLRCADNLTGYSPGPLERGTAPDRDWLAHELYTLCANALSKVAAMKRQQKTLRQAQEELRAAIYKRTMHSNDCPHWDYESTHCRECDAHDNDVRRARRIVRELRGTP